MGAVLLRKLHCGKPRSGTGRIVGKPEVATVGPIGNDKSANVEVSRMLGSVRCIQTLLAVPKSGSGKLGERGVHASGTVCPKTPILPWSQVTDSICTELPVLVAHKHRFVGLNYIPRIGAAVFVWECRLPAPALIAELRLCCNVFNRLNPLSYFCPARPIFFSNLFLD